MKTKTCDEALTTIPDELPLMCDAKWAAQVANTTETHIRAMCRRGEIQAVHVGGMWRINTAALLDRLGLA